MLKIRLALCLSLITAILTITFGVLNDLRLLTLAYRTLMSVIAFGICGYAVGLAADRFLDEIESQRKTKGQKIDIIAEDEVLTDTASVSFSPLTPDIYENISSKK